MSLTEQYINQFKWRDWSRAMARCPIKPGQRIIDLGCGPGEVSAALASHGTSVLGIDSNPELLGYAREHHPDCVFEQQDLRELRLPAANFDGLWCSFTAAYFVDFDQVLAQWCRHLKPSAWICIIDIEDLFNHQPLSATARAALAAFYEDAFTRGRYDFHAGRKLLPILESNGFVACSTHLSDQELAFAGSAGPGVLDAWRQRLQRMVPMQAFFGSYYQAFETEFLSCLAAGEHRSLCEVVCCVGTR